MRVLIVEDHTEVASWLSEELGKFDWECDVAETASQALARIRQRCYDVALLDVMLPDSEDMELCRQIASGSSSPLIMVTARDGLQDRIQALDNGADDYIIKPFAIGELIARIRAVLRRSTGDRGPVLEFVDLRLWPQERTVEQKGKVLELSKREFDLLETFMKNAKIVLAREQILELAWGYEFYAESNVVDVTVRRLRDRLDETGEVSIDTVRGVGYVLRPAARVP